MADESTIYIERDGITYSKSLGDSNEYEYDDGQQASIKDNLEAALVGRKVVDMLPRKTELFALTDLEEAAEALNRTIPKGQLILVLDNGTLVRIEEQSDCCAWTSIDEVKRNLHLVDNVITSVNMSEDLCEFYILTDFGQAMHLSTSFSCGNPFYYAYGLTIEVLSVEEYK